MTAKALMIDGKPVDIEVPRGQTKAFRNRLNAFHKRLDRISGENGVSSADVVRVAVDLIEENERLMAVLQQGTDADKAEEWLAAKLDEVSDRLEALVVDG